MNLRQIGDKLVDRNKYTDNSEQSSMCRYRLEKCTSMLMSRNFLHFRFHPRTWFLNIEILH